MTVYKVRRIILESYGVLLACAIIGLIAGYLLQLSMEEIRRLPLILMMVPPINGLGGNIGCILGARLTSALHLGTIEPKLRGQKMLNQNLLASAFMGSGVFLFVSAVLFAFMCIKGMALGCSASLMLSFLIASLILMTIIISLATASAFLSFRRGLDPDNIVIPIVTSVGDVLGVICLIMAIRIIGV